MHLLPDPSVDAHYLLRFDDLKRRGVVNNRVTLARWIRTLGFPPAITLGPNSVAWRKGDVDAWLASRPTRSPNAEAPHAA